MPGSRAKWPSDAALFAEGGSILNWTGGTAPNVKANRIDLVASGIIGTLAAPLLVDSGTTDPLTGRVYAASAGDVALTETAGALRILGAQSLTGSVQLKTTDTAAAGEDVIVLLGGPVLYAQNTVVTAGDPNLPTTDILAGVWARVNVAILAGDDVIAGADRSGAQPVLSYIVAEGAEILIRIDDGDADPGVGALAYLAGYVGPIPDIVTALVVRIYGNADDDAFVFDQTTLGAFTVARGGRTDTAGATDGEDAFAVIQLQTMNVAAGHVLWLDGQAQGDGYVVFTTGSEGDRRNYVIEVLDTGTSGVDALAVSGTDESDDLFLLRRIESIPGFTSTGPAFVTLLATGPAGIVPGALQRVNYDTGVDELAVQALDGDDRFLVDATTVPATLLGGDGADSFTLGQIYGSERTASVVDTPTDAFPTTGTTRGWVSQGPIQPLTAEGGDGDDTFLVLANVAEVALAGDAGDDLFTVRAFALAAGGYLPHGIIDGRRRRRVRQGGRPGHRAGRLVRPAEPVPRRRRHHDRLDADRGAGARHPGRRRRSVRRGHHGRRAHPGHRRPRQRRVHRARRPHPAARRQRTAGDPAAGAGPLPRAAARAARDRGRRQRRRPRPADGAAAAAGDGHRAAAAALEPAGEPTDRHPRRARRRLRGRPRSRC